MLILILILLGEAKSKTKKTTASALNSSCAVGDVVQVLSAAGTPEHTVIISKKQMERHITVDTLTVRQIRL